MLHERTILVVSLGPILRQVVIHVLRPKDLRPALSFFQFSAHLSRGAPSGYSSHGMSPGVFGYSCLLTGFILFLFLTGFILLCFDFLQDMWMQGKAH